MDNSVPIGQVVNAPSYAFPYSEIKRFTLFVHRVHTQRSMPRMSFLVSFFVARGSRMNKARYKSKMPH